MPTLPLFQAVETSIHSRRLDAKLDIKTCCHRTVETKLLQRPKRQLMPEQTTTHLEPSANQKPERRVGHAGYISAVQFVESDSLRGNTMPRVYGRGGCKRHTPGTKVRGVWYGTGHEYTCRLVSVSDDKRIHLLGTILYAPS